MLDQQKVCIARVKEAYSLNEHEADSLLNALSPDSIFPYELWQKAYATFWKASAVECARLYAISPPHFPEIGQAPVKYFPVTTYATWMINFFLELAKLIRIDALEKGYDYIVECVYDDKDNAFSKKKDDLFYIFYAIEKNISNAARIKGYRDISTAKEYYYSFMFKFFPDTILVGSEFHKSRRSALGLYVHNHLKYFVSRCWCM